MAVIINPVAGSSRLSAMRHLSTAPTRFPHPSDERGLAGPARPDDQDRRGIRKGFLRPPFHKPFEHAIPKARSIGTIIIDQLEVDDPLIGSDCIEIWKSRKGNAFSLIAAAIADATVSGNPAPLQFKVRERSGFP